MNDGGEARGLVKAPQDFAAGLFLIALALFALWLGRSLNPGTFSHMGPGMLPRAISILTGVTGLSLLVGSLLWQGPSIGFIAFRGPLFITLAILSFGLTIRGFAIPLPGGSVETPALGLLGAGPLAILISGLASSETKWRDLVIFAIVMTAFCWLLFKVALNLPIPLMPLIFGY